MKILKKIRAELKEMFSHDIYEAAKHNGLAIEYWESMPAHYDGHLDTTNEKPRFIGVNPDLPPIDQVYAIAREIARYAQLRQVNSLVLSRPSQWNLLPTAPAETRDYILNVDLEIRTYWIMHWHAGSNKDFFGFYRRHPKKMLLVWNSQIIADYVFWKLRIRNLLITVLSTLRLWNGKPNVSAF
jgi:hypothetical protein